LVSYIGRAYPKPPAAPWARSSPPLDMLRLPGSSEHPAPLPKDTRRERPSGNQIEWMGSGASTTGLDWLYPLTIRILNEVHSSYHREVSVLRLAVIAPRWLEVADNETTRWSTASIPYSLQSHAAGTPIPLGCETGPPDLRRLNDSIGVRALGMLYEYMHCVILRQLRPKLGDDGTRPVRYAVCRWHLTFGRH
jgi:hypothetical protein